MPLASLEQEIIAGSLAQMSAAASPDTFLWARLKDWALSLVDPSALDIYMRVERWTLDEVALPGRLVSQMIDWLYREDRLSRGILSICGKTVGPSNIRIPTLAVFNVDDEIAPLASIAPFIEKMPIKDKKIIEYSGEVGRRFATSRNPRRPPRLCRNMAKDHRLDTSP